VQSVRSRRLLAVLVPFGQRVQCHQVPYILRFKPLTAGTFGVVPLAIVIFNLPFL
jgi:hypothetical protein